MTVCELVALSLPSLLEVFLERTVMRASLSLNRLIHVHVILKKVYSPHNISIYFLEFVLGQTVRTLAYPVVGDTQLEYNLLLTLYLDHVYTILKTKTNETQIEASYRKTRLISVGARCPAPLSSHKICLRRNFWLSNPMKARTVFCTPWYITSNICSTLEHGLPPSAQHFQYINNNCH